MESYNSIYTLEEIPTKEMIGLFSKFFIIKTHQTLFKVYVLTANFSLSRLDMLLILVMEFCGE
jgi:hypothetical protein